MKFLIDAQLPPGLCLWLEARGHTADHVFTLGLGTATDAEIALRAERDGAILVTKDEDFMALRQPARFPLIWLRCGNATNRTLGAWLESRWESIEALLAAGEEVIEVR